jgi:hypothetical protein
MDIKWGHLGEVALTSFGVTVAVVVLFSLGIIAWARTDESHGPTPAGARSRVAAAAAALCFAACLAVAAYGIDIILND